MKESDVKVDNRRINKARYPFAYNAMAALLSAGERNEQSISLVQAAENWPDMVGKTWKDIVPLLKDKVITNFVDMGVWPLQESGKPHKKDSEIRKYAAGKAWLAQYQWVRTNYPAEAKKAKSKTALDTFRTAHAAFLKNATPKEWKTAVSEGLVPAGPKPKVTKIRK